MEIKKMMVIGAGQMGSGIAQVAAQAGYEVVLQDINDEFVRKGMGGIAHNLNRDAEKGKISSEEKDLILSRIQGTIDMSSAKDCDLVVEAAIENKDIKKGIFQRLDQICPPNTIFATNTSSLPITQLAATTKRADQFIGMHFMNPVPVMRLVEIIRGLDTSDETYRLIYDITLKMGKEPLEVNDAPGFVSNRVLMMMINEAVFCLYEGIGSPESIDGVMKLGMNHPMGPLALADLIGLDTCLYIIEVLYEGFKDSKYRPCPLLRKYVDAGRLGRKVGRGFYSY